MREKLGAALIALVLVACVAPDEVEQLKQNQLILLQRMERLEKKLTEAPTVETPAPAEVALFSAFAPSRACVGFEGPQLSFAREPMGALSEDPVNARTLQRAVDIVRGHRSAQPLELQVHTGAQGSSAYNLKLSQLRAEAIKAAMVKLGADAARLVAKGYGESQAQASTLNCDLNSRMVLYAR